MKRTISLLIVALLLFSLTACGGSSEPAASTPAKSEGASSAAQDLKVGAIYINSKNDTAGYTFAHHNGITTAMNELGLDTATQLVIVD